jgi:hypothetical protein
MENRARAHLQAAEPSIFNAAAESNFGLPMPSQMYPSQNGTFLQPSMAVYSTQGSQFGLPPLQSESEFPRSRQGSQFLDGVGSA